MIKLKRTPFFLIGFAMIFCIYFLCRIIPVMSGEQTTAEFVFYVEEDTHDGKLIFPIFEYPVKDTVFQFKGREETTYELGEKVPVLLLKGDFNQPVLYTFGSYWAFPLVFLILPVAIWTAFSLSWLSKRERVEIQLKKPFFRKKLFDLDL